MNYITKRNKTKEKFDRKKIIRGLQVASMGLSVDLSPVMEEIKGLDVIPTTQEIQMYLVNRTLSLTNVNLDGGLNDDAFKGLNYDYLAARLLMHDIYAEVYHSRESTINYSDVVHQLVADGVYSKVLTDSYTKEDLENAYAFINKKYDNGFRYAGVNLFKTRYLIRDKSGNLAETPQEMYLTISLMLASNEPNKLEMAEKIYHATAARKISLATPILMNLRKKDGNLSSCFITSLSDDLDDMFYQFKQIAQISKNGGGVGVNISGVRAKGADIRGVKGAAVGVMPFTKIINDIGIAINQLGTRKGAITPALDIWHLDINEFLHCRTENGDLRSKTFDIFPQVVIPDLFMKRVESDGHWTLFDPHEINEKYGVRLEYIWGEDFENLYKVLELDSELTMKETVLAKNLWKDLLKVTVETGLPYVAFKDAMNKGNPNKHAGLIRNGNLCMESFSNFDECVGEDGHVHVCNLISLNFSQIEDDEIEHLADLSVRILDNTIDLTSAPILEAENHNEKYRIIGIGAMGLHDYLAKRSIPYTNSVKQVGELFEKVAFYSLIASHKLAQERGSYKMFEGSDFNRGVVFGRDKGWYKNKENVSISPDKWVDLINAISRDGIRNGSLFAIAPNTGTGQFVGGSAGVLPIFKRFFIETSKGSVPNFPEHLNKDTFWFYNENINTDQNHVINVVSEIQKWTDQGISMELFLNLNSGIKAKQFSDWYFNGWRKGLKTVYYVRSQAKKSNDSDCLSCSN